MASRIVSFTLTMLRLGREKRIWLHPAEGYDP
jgi:hypothetical protein